MYPPFSQKNLFTPLFITHHAFMTLSENVFYVRFDHQFAAAIEMNIRTHTQFNLICMYLFSASNIDLKIFIGNFVFAYTRIVCYEIYLVCLYTLAFERVSLFAQRFALRGKKKIYSLFKWLMVVWDKYTATMMIICFSSASIPFRNVSFRLDMLLSQQ